MAVDPTVTRSVGEYDMTEYQVTWVLLTANPAGTAFQYPEFADRTFQVGAAGDVFGGATVTIEGSHDGVTFSPLSNAAGGAAATFAAAGMKTIVELPRFMRPNLTVVGVGASITCILLARRATPSRT